MLVLELRILDKRIFQIFSILVFAMRKIQI